MRWPSMATPAPLAPFPLTSFLEEIYKKIIKICLNVFCKYVFKIILTHNFKICNIGLLLK